MCLGVLAVLAVAVVVFTRGRLAYQGAAGRVGGSSGSTEGALTTVWRDMPGGRRSRRQSGWAAVSAGVAQLGSNPVGSAQSFVSDLISSHAHWLASHYARNDRLSYNSHRNIGGYRWRPTCSASLIRSMRYLPGWWPEG
jgi:hypothetical protein